MTPGIPESQVTDMRRLLRDVNDELSIAVLQIEMLLESGGSEAQSRGSLEESLDACRKAAESLKRAWLILGPRRAP